MKWMLTAFVTAALLVAGGRASSQVPTRDPRPAAPRTGTAVLSGRVVTDTGMPVRRASVRLSSAAADFREGRVATTDGDGQYEFRDLPAGTYAIYATKAGYVQPDATPGTSASSHSVKVGEGQKIRSPDFVLARGCAITGHVLDEYGDPVAYARVEVMRRQFRDGAYRLTGGGSSATTDDLGQYRVFGLRPGNYYVSASQQQGSMFQASMFSNKEETDRAGYARTYYPSTSNVGNAVMVRVAAGQDGVSTDIALLPTRTARVSGVVLDSRGRITTSATLTVRQIVPGVSSYGETGTSMREGTFTLFGLVPGDYVLTARSGDFPASPGPPPTPQEAGRLQVTVAGSDLTGLTIQMSRGGTASGQVIFETPLPAGAQTGGIRVAAVPDDLSGSSLALPGQLPELRPDGTFTVTGLFGSRVFRVAGLPNGWALKSVSADGRDVTDVPINFEGREQITGLQMLVTSRVTKLTGAVTATEGQSAPPALATIMVLAQDPERWSPSSRYRAQVLARTDRWTITGLPPGDYFAVAMDQATLTAVMDADDVDPRELLRKVGTPFSIGEGETKELTLKLARLPDR